MLARLDEAWNRRILRMLSLGLLVSMVALSGCADDDDDDNGDDGDESGTATVGVRGEGSPGWGWIGSVAAIGGAAALVAWKRRTA